jgi:hypothetical protein
VSCRDVPAAFARGRRLRIVIDWTLALLFRPDAVKVGLDSETALLLREVASRDAAA